MTTVHGWLRSRSFIVLLGFLAIIVFLLVTEHTAHVFRALPYLLLLACPAMHLFHRGHKHARGRHNESPPDGASR
jgi:hypothetical protein